MRQNGALVKVAAAAGTLLFVSAAVLVSVGVAALLCEAASLDGFAGGMFSGAFSVAFVALFVKSLRDGDR